MGAEENWTVIFTYGTLKRGFSNHGLMQDLILAGDAIYLGHAVTATPLPLVCGPYSVPFLLNLPGAGDRVRGEFYSVSPQAQRAFLPVAHDQALREAGSKNGEIGSGGVVILIDGRGDGSAIRPLQTIDLLWQRRKLFGRMFMY